MSLRWLAKSLASCALLSGCAAKPAVEPPVLWDDGVPLQAASFAGRSKLAELSPQRSSQPALWLVHVNHRPWTSIPSLASLSSRRDTKAAVFDARSLFGQPSTYVSGHRPALSPPGCAAEQAAVSWYVLQAEAPGQPAQISTNSGLIERCRIERLRSATSPLAALATGLVLGYRSCETIDCEPLLPVPSVLRLLTPRAQFVRVGGERFATEEDPTKPFSLVDVPVARGESSVAVLSLTGAEIDRWRKLRGEAQLDSDQMLVGPMELLLVRVEVDWLENEEAPTVRTSVSAYGEPGRTIAKWLGFGAAKEDSK